MERDRGKEKQSCETVKRDDTVNGEFNQTSLYFYAFFMLRGQCVICMQRGRIVRNQRRTEVVDDLSM